jgi:hypothetical protein
MDGMCCIVLNYGTPLILYVSIPTPILDNKWRVIGICAGHPDDPSWGTAKVNTTASMQDAHEKLHIPEGSKSHWRGKFLAFAVGASFGGG